MKLILYYFSIPFWRAEVTRLCLYMNDIEFVDHRISDTERDQFKKNGQLPNGMIAPFCQLPVLEVDGKIVAQTGAIARFSPVMNSVKQFAVANFQECILLIMILMQLELIKL